MALAPATHQQINLGDEVCRGLVVSAHLQAAGRHAVKSCWRVSQLPHVRHARAPWGLRLLRRKTWRTEGSERIERGQSNCWRWTGKQAGLSEQECCCGVAGVWRSWRLQWRGGKLLRRHCATWLERGSTSRTGEQCVTCFESGARRCGYGHARAPAGARGKQCRQPWPGKTRSSSHGCRTLQVLAQASTQDRFAGGSRGAHTAAQTCRLLQPLRMP